jgi:hypothetical protein
MAGHGLINLKSAVARISIESHDLPKFVRAAHRDGAATKTVETLAREGVRRMIASANATMAELEKTEATKRGPRKRSKRTSRRR